MVRNVGMKSFIARCAQLLPSSVRPWYALPLRLVLGLGLIEHGYAKLARGPDTFAAILHALGVPSPTLMAWATIAVEIVGGLAVLVGAFIPLASVPLAAVLMTAAVTVHLPFGFSSIKLQAVTSDGPQFGPPGYETLLLYLTGLVALLLGGSGPFALDRWLLDRHGRKSPSAME
jgi:putative oxidoreductase